MSWSEVFKINKNMKRALNEQMRDIKYNPLTIITSSTTYKPPKTGLYKIICVGKGGNSGGYNGGNANQAIANSGGAGGVAIKTLRLSSATSYSITVSTTASFSSELTATAGEDGANTISSSSIANGGTASGGDYNYEGGKGSNISITPTFGDTVKGGDTGVFISDLYHPMFYYDKTNNMIRYYGRGVLEYGGGAPAARWSGTGGNYAHLDASGLPAAVIIIPIEMEE